MKTTQFTARNTRKLAMLSIFTLGACAMSVNGYAADSSAAVFAQVAEPISISQSQDMNLGMFLVGASGGKVIIDHISDNNFTTVTGDVVLLDNLAQRAVFTVSGEDNMTYTISTSTSAGALTTSDGTAMTITYSHASTGTIPGVGFGDIKVGAELNVNGGQTPGYYNGSLVATVEYQ
jgi:hypothetical protein